MITLITAVPGSGKTLYTLKTLAEIAKREDRQVYYYGIKLTDYGKEHLGWVELEDPHKWYELPAMAIVVIDEFQKVFPKRPMLRCLSTSANLKPIATWGLMCI